MDAAEADPEAVPEPVPTYTEPTVHKVIDGVSKAYRDEMQLYIVEARFKLSRPPSSIDLKRYTTLPFIQNIDPSIKHQQIKAVRDDAADGREVRQQREPGPQMVRGASA